MREPFIIIDTSGSQFIYPAAYMGAMFVATVVAFRSGIKKGLPSVPWLLAIIAGGTLFVIFEKIFTYSLTEWNAVATGLTFPRTGKRIVLGGAVGLVTGLLLAKKWLRMRGPVLDHYAIALPLGMAITRLGCLKAGCCFGTPTNLPWGISYGHASMAFRSQQMNGYVDYDAPFSVPVHPVQIYEITGCILIAILVWKMRNRFRAGENLFLFFIICYSLFRFFIEFLRAPLPGTFPVHWFSGLKILQIILLAVSIISILILVTREVTFKPGSDMSSAMQIPKWRQFTLFAGISAVICLIRNWITVNDLILSMIFLVPVCIYWLEQMILKPLNRTIYEN